MALLRAAVQKLLPYLRLAAKRAPQIFRIGLFRVIGIGDTGYLSYILLTTVVFLPALSAFSNEGVVGVLAFLGTTLGTSTESLVAAIHGLPRAGSFQVVWGLPPRVDWVYAGVLWSFLYSAATVIWFYRGLHFSWVFFFGSDESRLKTVIVFTFLYIPVVYAYTGGLPLPSWGEVRLFVDSLPFTDVGEAAVNNTSAS